MKRHYCKFCGAKRNESAMTAIHYRLLKKSYWTCKNHVSTIADIFEIKFTEVKPVFVEIFSGSGHVSEVARERGYETVTIDNQKKLNPDICVDITNLRRSILPSSVHVVWASIPCTTYSVLSCSHHWKKIKIGYRKYYYAPRTDDAIAALRILSATIDLVKKLNPIFYFFENPRGALRHFPHLSFVPNRRTVAYSDYGFDYYKPTDIWTNCNNFKPKEIESAMGKEFDSGVLDLKDNYERSLIPELLIKEVLDSVGKSIVVEPGLTV